MFLKDFFLKNLAISFKSIEQVKNYRSIIRIIPNLHQIDAVFSPKNRIIQIKTLMFSQNFIPVSCNVCTTSPFGTYARELPLLATQSNVSWKQALNFRKSHCTVRI